MPDYDEKRDFQRMSLESELSFIDTDGDTQKGVVKNLSAKGIMFTAGQDLKIGDPIEITLTPSNNLTPPMTASVVITRCDPEENGSYQVAGEISQIH